MSGFVKVGSVNDIPEGRLKKFEMGPHRFLVVHTAEGFFALVDECSHESRPLSDGRIRGSDIVCRAHGARFDIATGAVTAPPALVPVDTLEIKIEEDEIQVYLED